MSSTGGTAPRIVFVLPTYLPESFGGAEQQSRKLALALGRLGVDVTVLAPRLKAHTAADEADATIRLRRFRLSQPPNLGGRHMGSFLLWAVKLLWWLTRRRRDYDVIHIIHGRLHAVPAVMAGLLLRKPTLIKLGRGGIEHFDIDLLRRKRWFGSWYARAVVRYTTGFVANSQEIVDDLRRWKVDEQRIFRIPNGVEIPVIERPARTAPPLRFVYLGRLDSEKSIDLMIRGFGRVEPRDRATLALVGDGTERASLERLVSQSDLQHVVTFAGAVRDVSATLAEADVFVSTSVSEGMSNALLEAMSFGLVPLVSRVSGVGDVVQDGESGLLFEPGNLDAFVARLRDTLALPHSARASLGANARATVTKRFGIDHVARRHLDVYAALRRSRAEPLAQKRNRAPLQ